MAIVTDAQLYQYFETGDIPTQQQFRDLIDSKLNVLTPLPGGNPEVGVTQILSGADKLILFQNGTTLSQDSGFAFDYTNKRLGVTTATPESAISVQSSTGNSSSETLALSFKRTDSPSTNTHVGAMWGLNNSNTILTNVGTFYESGGGQRFSVLTSADNTTAGTEKMRLSKLGRLSLGATMLDGAMLDIQAAGSLSTDIALRVRNSANTANIVTVQGDGFVGIGKTGVNARLEILAQGNGSGNNIFTIRNSADTNQLFNLTGDGQFVFRNNAATTSIEWNNAFNLVFKQSTYTSSIVFGQYPYFYGDNATAIGIRTPNNAFTMWQNSNFVFGNNSSIQQGTGKNNILLQSGTAPSSNIADHFYLYSADITAGNAAPHFRTENGNIIKIYQETTGVAAATHVSGSGTNVKLDDTFDGYTVQQIVKALRNHGLLA